MATFPALRPASRTYTPPTYPGVAHVAYSGRESRVRTSNASTGARLRLQFPGISEAQMLEIASHYAGQRGRFLPFLLPGEVLSGMSNPAVLSPAGYVWIYAGSPQITDISIGTAAAPACVHDVEVELELVPEVSRLAGGARWTAVATLAGGAASGGNPSVTGARWTATASIVNDTNAYGGSATGAAWTAAATITGGFTGTSAIRSGAAWSAAAAIAGGVATNQNGASSTGAAWSAAAAIAGGAGSTSGATDPNFSDVSLLLHMDGSNGSTTFTDSSGSPKTIERYGNTQISTAQSKFGGASALFDGNGDGLTAPTGTAFAFSGDFTVEAWIRIAGSPAGDYIIFDNGNTSLRSNAFVLQINSTRKLRVVNDGTIRIETTAVVPINEWSHVAFTRSSNVWRLFIDGVVDGSTYTSSVNLSAGACTIGITYSLNSSINGYIDDLRITKGVARYTANFTPPTAAFPDS